MVIAGYGRVSTDKKDQLNSLENQESYFQREIKLRGHDLYNIYLDKGLTGTKLNNRPEFEKMLTDAGLDIKVLTDDPHDGRKHKKHTVYELSDRAPMFDEVWIKNTSRFARNTLSYEIITLLRIKGVNIFFIEQNINSSDLTQDIMLKLMQIFDEQDSKDKSVKVRTGNEEGANKNVIRTNSKIYGYTYIQSENRLVVVPEEAKIVSRIFELYSSGIGTRKICSILTADNIYTRANKPFATNTIMGILSNEKYTGYNNPLKLDTGVVFAKYSNPKVKKNYRLLKCDRIEPIISVELFRKCRGELESRTSHNKKGIYHGYSKYASVLVCKKCGNRFYANSKGDSAYYICKTKRIHGAAACNSAIVYEKDIESKLILIARSKLNSALDDVKIDAVNKLIIKIDTLLKEANGEHKFSADTIKNEIESVKSKLDSYYELYANSRSNRDVLMQKINACESELDDLNFALNESSKDKTEIKQQIIDCIEIMKKLTRNEKNKTITFNELVEMIDKIFVYEEDTKPVYEFTFKMFKNMKIEYAGEECTILNEKTDISKDRIKEILDAAESYVYGNVS